MPKYVLLGNWTDQGVKNVRDTVKRSREAREAFASIGVNAREWIFTHGPYDVVLTVEAPDEETLTRAVLSLSELGNMRTVTLRGFSENEMERLVGNLI
ncbi:MAG: GYD domain-containing protein [Magnetospiraceae bacterium]